MLGNCYTEKPTRNQSRYQYDDRVVLEKDIRNNAYNTVYKSNRFHRVLEDAQSFHIFLSGYCEPRLFYLGIGHCVNCLTIHPRIKTNGSETINLDKVFFGKNTLQSPNSIINKKISAIYPGVSIVRSLHLYKYKKKKDHNYNYKYTGGINKPLHITFEQDFPQDIATQS